MSANVPKAIPLSRNKIEKAAAAFRASLPPDIVGDHGAITDTEELLEHLRDEDVVVEFSECLAIGQEAFYSPLKNTIVFKEEIARKPHEPRNRFTIAHELGHFVLHREQYKDVIFESGRGRLYRREDLKPYEDPEWQANCFAAALLMPRESVTLLTQGLEFAEACTLIKDTFMVSWTAARNRLREIRKVKSGPQKATRRQRQLTTR